MSRRLRGTGEGEPKCESKGGGATVRSAVKGRHADNGKMKSHLRSVGDLHAPGLGEDMAKDAPVTARTDERKENTG